MKIRTSVRVLSGVAVLLATSGPASAVAYKCDDYGYDSGNGYTPMHCMPPMLESVEQNSFAFVFKLADIPYDLSQPIVVTLYDSVYTATYNPKSCITLPAGGGYRKVSSTQFPNVTVQPDTQYAYNVNVGASCNCGSSSCTVTTDGTWFNTRRYVRTAPRGRPASLTFAVIGDTRDASQGECVGGYAQSTYGDIHINDNCGGNAGQRAGYAQAVHALQPSFIVHTGDIASSDDPAKTLEYWWDIGQWWRDIPTTFLFGNHEFGTPANLPQGHQQEIFGTASDTLADDMIAPPSTPVPGAGGVPYPGGANTYYAQNYGNVHVVYLNAQLCMLMAFNNLEWTTDSGLVYDHCPNGNPQPKGWGPGPWPKYETANTIDDCGCWDHSNAQRTWLRDNLRAANRDPAIDFIVVTLHKPYWSNGQNDSNSQPQTSYQEWTNTLARREYQYQDYTLNNLSFAGGLAADGPTGFADTGFIPLDAMFQMYNVDLVVTSHAHFYERLNDRRYRVTSDPGLPHLTIGGGGSAEQAYQCPYNDTHCSAASHAFSWNHLPFNVDFKRALDGNFYVGALTVDNTNLAAPVMQLNAIEIDDTNFSNSLVDMWSGSGIVSRKSQIRYGGPHHGSNDAFNGCNLIYSTTNGLMAYGTTSPTLTATNINCTVQ